MRRHRISDWNVWYGSFGKTDYAKQMGNFVIVRSLFDLCLLPFQLLGDIFGSLVRAKQRRDYQIALILDKIDKEISKIEAPTSSRTVRRNAANRTLSHMDDLSSIGANKKMQDYEHWRRHLQIVIKTADTLDYLEKADKQKFLRNKTKEKKYLLEALYSLIRLKVTNAEFNSLEIWSEGSQTAWTVKGLKKRLLEAGYVPE